MRITIRFTAALVALLALCLSAPALAAGPAVVSAFYYPWFGSPEDGGYAHWAQNGHAPPVDIASNYYPAYGPYSSSNQAVIATQLSDPNSKVAQGVNGAANYLTAAICKMTGNKPGNVCTAAPIPALQKKLG